MLTFQEKLVRIETLKDQGIIYSEIGKSLEPSLTSGNVWQMYRRYIQPFSESFHFIVKGLKQEHMAKYEEECRSLLYFFLSHIKERTKIRNVNLLTPLVSYLVFRLRGEIITTTDFCQIFNIPSSDFKKGVLMVIELYLEHHPSSQDEFMLGLIDRMKTELSRDPIHEFYVKSLKTFNVSSMDDLLDEFIAFYHSIREKIADKSKYKFLEVSGPIILYMFLKTKGILIPLPKFLGAYQLNYHKFTTDLKMMITRYYPKYLQRDKTSIVKKYIMSIFKNFNHTNEDLFIRARTLYEFFHPILHNAKEEVIAAVICVLTIISCDLPDIAMYHVCNEAGIKQSSLSMQFIGKIYPYLGIPDGMMLKKAFPLIKHEIFQKLLLKFKRFH